MPRPAALLVMLLAASGTLPGAAEEQRTPASPSRQDAGSASGTAVIRGRILAAGTGAPIRRAQVRASWPNVPARLTTTDADGYYELRGLPAGRWVVTAAKAGFISWEYGQRRPFTPGTPIEVADGQRVNADIALTRGGALTGHLYDEFGDPVAGAQVQVLRSRMTQGRRRLAPVGAPAQTDDLGAFRLYGLAPGDYYVSASLRASPNEPSADTGVYAPTYFPGTASAGEAQRITLPFGVEQPGINFALLPVRPVRVSGRVLTSGGAPASSASVRMVPGAADDEMSVSTEMAIPVRSDGAFTFINVVPGSYVLTATVARGLGDPEVASLPIFVGADDLSDVTLTATRGATIAGVVVGESGARTPPGSMSVVAHALRSGAGVVARRAAVQSDGTFRLSGLVGPTALRIEGVPSGWMLQSISVGGVDVTDSPLDLGGTEDITGARVTLTSLTTQLTGTVDDAGRGADRWVVVYADDPSKWAFPSRHLHTAKADADGRFHVSRIPPGERYLAVAVEYLEDGEGADPLFLERMRPLATGFGLRAGEARTLRLRTVER